MTPRHTQRSFGNLQNHYITLSHTSHWPSQGPRNIASRRRARYDVVSGHRFRNALPKRRRDVIIRIIQHKMRRIKGLQIKTVLTILSSFFMLDVTKSKPVHGRVLKWIISYETKKQISLTMPMDDGVSNTREPSDATKNSKERSLLDCWAIFRRRYAWNRLVYGLIDWYLFRQRTDVCGALRHHLHVYTTPHVMP